MFEKSFKIIVAVFCVTWMIKEVLIPVTVGAYYSSSYKKLVIACDTAMDDSWYQKKKKLGKTEQIQLLSCHDYDKIRKVMLISGVSREYLSYLGLSALDIYQRPAEEYVKQHRFEKR